MTNVYVATSWRNTLQPFVVQSLIEIGYSVYDFRNPGPEKEGFAFANLSANWINLDQNIIDPYDYMTIINSQQAKQGYLNDYNAMCEADIFVMLLPCERDAHLELGWAAGAGKETHILLDNPCKASLMYQMADYIHPDLEDLISSMSNLYG